MNKLIIVLACALAVVLARPNDGHVSVWQNSLGNYKYTVETGDTSRSEERFPDGTIVGHYTLLNEDGSRRLVKYTSGPNGFQILDDLPNLEPVKAVLEPIQDTPEVAEERRKFFEAYNAALHQ